VVRGLAPVGLAVAASVAVTAGCTSGGPESMQRPTASVAPPAATSEPPPPSRRPERAPSVRLALTGDVLLHDGLWDVARADARRAGQSPGSLDFGPILQPTRPVIRAADIAICHLETPVAESAGPFQSYPAFSVPPQILSAIAGTGFDACTTASNHSVDQGFEGVTRTLDAMDRNGIRHTGTARSAREQRRLLRMRAGGLELALLSYT